MPAGRARESREHFTRSGPEGDRPPHALLGGILRADVGDAPPDRRRHPRHLRRAPAGGARGDHHLRGHPRLPAAARARRVDPPAAAHRGRDTPAALRPGPPRHLAPGCAYRPRYEWTPPTGRESGRVRSVRPGLEEMLAAHGLEYFVADSHLVAAGRPLFLYRDYIPLKEGRGGGPSRPRRPPKRARPYPPYRVASRGGTGQAVAFFRDPRTTLQVWSREHGYPGEHAYLEFHKKHFPGGLRFWRVTDNQGDLGDKAVYDPQRRRPEGAPAGEPLRRAGRGHPRARGGHAAPPSCARRTIRSCSATGGSRARPGSSTVAREHGGATAAVA